jgi:hypothetical protein
MKQINIKMTTDTQVSFTWIYQSFGISNKIIAYCFAYVKNKDTNGIFYAGVKYKGEYSKLRQNRPFLRNTAVKRLIKKPIYCVYNPSKDVISDKKNRFNGFDYISKKDQKNRKPKECISMGKFFIKSGLGIYCDIKNSDLKMLYNRDKSNPYEIYNSAMLTNKIENGHVIHIKFGLILEGNGDILKSVNYRTQGGYFSGKNYEDLITLRRNSNFFGQGKNRYRLDDYENIPEEYLLSLGINKKDHYEQPRIEVKMDNSYREMNIKYFKAMLSNKTRIHIAFMKIDEWVNHLSKTHKKDYSFTIDPNEDDIYCIGFSIEDITKTNKKLGPNGRRFMNKKIAIDKMRERPHIISADFFKEMNIRQLRMWFFHRIPLLTENTNRLHFEGNELHFEGSLMIYETKKHSEYIMNYELTELRQQMGWFERLIRNIFLI